MERLGIIGQNGFIGSHLVKELDRSKHLYATFHGDLLNPDHIQNYFNEVSPNTIIFLVGGHFPPIDNLLTKNVLTLSNLLEIGTKNGLKKIIYASSGAVYGNTDNHPAIEQDSLQPNSLYGLTKKLAEEVITYYQTITDLESIILRFTSIYGDGNKTGVIYNFWKGITENQHIVIEGDGTQVRDFLHIQDAIRAILLSIKFGNSDIFNISTPTRTSINDLVELFRHKYKFEIIHKPSNNTLSKMTLDSSKANMILDFKPQITQVIIP